MSHSLCKIWIHAAWATKERTPIIHQSVEQEVYKQMYTQFTDIASPARIINGMPDHVHCLFRLNPQKAITDIIKQVKGGTSYWINQRSLLKEKFAWQTGFGAFSVSESMLEKVYLYILNQKQHHVKKTFEDEFKELIKLHGLALDC